jgi:hypothetical protein
VNRTPPRRFALLRRLRIACLLLAACAAGAPALGEEAIPLEKRIKAAYLAKLPGYVTWPESAFAKPDAPLVFGVLGDEQVAAELAQAVAGHDLDGHPLAVRRLREGESLANLQVLFVAGRARLGEVARATEKQPLLLVTESEGALERGSVVNFTLVSEHVKFDIALDSAEKRGLKLSSRLLGVARSVRPGGAP